MRGLYGTPPAGLVAIPEGAVQCSPLAPGVAAIEEMADGSLESFIVHAPRGTLERRYVLAQALRTLKPGASLVALAGNKLGGARLATELEAFGCAVEEAARHHFRVCSTAAPAEIKGMAEAIAAGALRFVDVLRMWSQPGIFSWDRIDPGTALLIEHLPALTGRGADLGCGIGVLARAALPQTSITHLTLIDADRRAVEAARRNVGDARAGFMWADATRPAKLPKGLDFVIMNPPFHDGGREAQDLGRAFIASAAQMLKAGGQCVLVANRHLPYEAVMKPLFADIRQIAQTGGFKVYVARR